MLTGVGKPLLLLSKLRRIVCRPLPRTATVTVVALPNAPRQGYNQLVLLSLKITWPRKGKGEEPENSLPLNFIYEAEPQNNSRKHDERQERINADNSDAEALLRLTAFTG